MAGCDTPIPAIDQTAYMDEHLDVPNMSKTCIEHPSGISVLCMYVATAYQIELRYVPEETTL